MKRIAAFLLLGLVIAVAPGWAMAKKENRSIGENGREAKRAAKQHQRYVNKSSRKQRRTYRKSQKAQRRAAKQGRRRS
jgi:predicted lipid-binding transport protein (Tim44 family)